MCILQNVVAYCWFEIFYIFHEKYRHRIHDDVHSLNYTIHSLTGTVIECTVIHEINPEPVVLNRVKERGCSTFDRVLSIHCMP